MPLHQRLQLLISRNARASEEKHQEKHPGMASGQADSETFEFPGQQPSRLLPQLQSSFAGHLSLMPDA